jgi:DNA modification methylase
MGKDSKTNVSPKGAKAKPSNSLYYGDNLEVMRKYLRDESVDLCYMDPPFNSNRSYNQIYSKPGEHNAAQAQAFIDTWEWDTRAMAGFREILENAHARFSKQLVDLIRGLHRVLGEQSLFAYLVGMSLRLVEVHRVLKDTGSFYLHCDPTASHYLKIVLDAIFGAGNFRNEIVWRRSRAHNDRKIRRFGAIHDTLLFYSKTDAWLFSPQFISRDANAPKTHDLYVHTDGKTYRKDNCRAPGDRGPRYEWNGHTHHWRFSPEERDRLIAAGCIVYSKSGMPRVLRPIDPNRGSPLQDVWNDIDAPNSGSKEALGYPTQKPLGLLDRIILTSSNEDAVILDPCCGCGTTIASADLKQRKWIGIDITYQSIALVLQRLEDQSGARWPEVEQSIAITGIPRDMASAVALAHKKDDRVRKEFEKWAVLTYTNNRGKINEKKGADAGIDGRVHFMTGRTENATMIFQVKSGIVHRDDIAKLRGDMEKDGAALATLITLTEPTDPMFRDARTAGLYHHELMDRDYDKIQIVTIQEILDGKRLDIPLVKDLAVKRPGKKTAVSEELMLPGLDGPREEALPDPIDMIERLKGTLGRRAPKSAASAESKLKTGKKSDRKPSR